MQLRPDNILQEFTFSEQEELLVKTLSPLQIAWFQSKYTRIFKEKASTIVPEESSLDRSYLLKLGEMEGKLSILQEIFDDHKNAISRNKELNAIEGVSAKTTEIATLSTHASQLVNQN